MIEFNQFNVLVMTAQNGGQVGLHISVAIFLAVVAIVFLVIAHHPRRSSTQLVQPGAARRWGLMP
jgi:hypothetical protein